MAQKNIHIIVSSRTRSGTTLVVQILKEIFGNKNVDVTHGYRIPYNYIVIPYRDIRDIVCSYRRVFNPSKKDKEFSLWELLKYSFILKIFALRSIRWELINKKILWLKYENFVEDFDYLFDHLEDYFNIKITRKKREYFKDKYSKKNKKNINSNFGTNHVEKGEVNQWKHLVPKKYHSLLYFTFRRELIKYNYAREVK